MHFNSFVIHLPINKPIVSLPEGSDTSETASHYTRVSEKMHIPLLMINTICPVSSESIANSFTIT